MDKNEYFIDDRVEVPVEIMEMSERERLDEIKRLEEEALKEKYRILNKEKIA